MLASTLTIVADLIREAANPLTGSSSDYDNGCFAATSEARRSPRGQAWRALCRHA
jgi:hypothetical protein